MSDFLYISLPNRYVQKFRTYFSFKPRNKTSWTQIDISDMSSSTIGILASRGKAEWTSLLLLTGADSTALLMPSGASGRKRVFESNYVANTLHRVATDTGCEKFTLIAHRYTGKLMVEPILILESRNVTHSNLVSELATIKFDVLYKIYLPFSAKFDGL